MMETWTLQEGFPLVTVEVKGREVRLSQERYLKSDDPSQTSRFNINIKDNIFMPVILIVILFLYDLFRVYTFSPLVLYSHLKKVIKTRLNGPEKNSLMYFLQ